MLKGMDNSFYSVTGSWVHVSTYLIQTQDQPYHHTQLAACDYRKDGEQIFHEGAKDTLKKTIITKFHYS